MDNVGEVALGDLPAVRLAALRLVATWANAATMVRTLAAVALGLASVATASRTLLLVAYAVYWVGDIADGQLARRLDQETRIGAVLDITSDRACCSVLVCALAAQHPRLWPALAVYLVQFMAVDAVLSLAFLRWPLLSPNYFYAVDRVVWRWNWSPLAKSVTTCGVVAAVLTGQLPVALTIAVVQLVLKIWSAWVVLGIAAALRPPRALNMPEPRVGVPQPSEG